MKIHEIFCENPRIIFVLFYDVHKKNMFTINLEDGRKAPYKASILNFIVYSFLNNWQFVHFNILVISNVFKTFFIKTRF